ncbi:MAG: hypothetical protein IJQ43_01180 [Oscillospiraceae bacterium]|nr:hypothetical protein [Oscillospiraceae bacterium]
MIARLKEAVQSVAALFSRRRDVCLGQEEKEVIQGVAGNVIIVKSPNTEYFKEAIFILCDDLFARRGVDRAQLLRQARRAAHSYVDERVPPRDLRTLWHVFFYLLGFVSALALLVLLQTA